MADKDISIKIKADSKNAQSNIQKLTGNVNDLKKKLSTNELTKFSRAMQGLASTGSLLKMGFSALQNAFKAVKDTVIQTVEAYKVQRQAENALAVAIKNSPVIDGTALKGLKDFASQLQKNSDIGDETTLAFMTQLAAAGRTQQQIQDIIQTSADMAAGGVMSMGEAVKALNATYTGLSGTLGRQNSSIKDLTKEQLKNGDAVKILGTQYKGMALAVADSKKQLDNAKGDFKEVMGQLLNPITTGWDNFWRHVIEGGTKALGKIVEYRDKHGVTAIKSDVLDFSSIEEGYKEAAIKGKGAIDYYFKQMQQHIKEYSDDQIQSQLQMTMLGNLTTAESAYKNMLLQETKARQEANAHQKDMQKYMSMSVAELEAFIKKNNEAIEKYKNLSLVKIYQTKGALAREALEAKQQEAANQKAQDALDLIKENDAALKQKLQTLQNQATSQQRSVSLQEKLNAYQQSYNDLLTKGAGLITPQDDIARTRLSQIQDIQKQITQEEALTATLDLKAKIDAALATFDTPDIYQVQITALEQLRQTVDALNDSQYTQLQQATGLAASKQDVIQGIDTVIQKTQQEAYIRQVEGATTIEELETLEAQYTKAFETGALSRDTLDEALSQKRLERWQKTQEQITAWSQQSTDIVKQAGDGMLEYVENQATLQTAALEKQFQEGLISQAEYEDKKQRIAKDSAKKEYQIKMIQWTADLMQAQANIALGMTRSLSEEAPTYVRIINSALVAAAGAVQTAALIANKPVPPSFATGGIVGGSSYTGDKISARVNSGEMILNKKQQQKLFSQLNASLQPPTAPIASTNGTGGLNIQIINKAAAIASVEPPVIDKNKILLMIDQRVAQGLKDGTFDAPLAQAQANAEGVFYGM